MVAGLITKVVITLDEVVKVGFMLHPAALAAVEVGMAMVVEVQVMAVLVAVVVIVIVITVIPQQVMADSVPVVATLFTMVHMAVMGMVRPELVVLGWAGRFLSGQVTLHYQKSL